MPGTPTRPNPDLEGFSSEDEATATPGPTIPPLTALSPSFLCDIVLLAYVLHHRLRRTRLTIDQIATTEVTVGFMNVGLPPTLGLLPIFPCLKNVKRFSPHDNLAFLPVTNTLHLHLPRPREWLELEEDFAESVGPVVSNAVKEGIIQLLLRHKKQRNFCENELNKLTDHEIVRSWAQRRWGMYLKALEGPTRFPSPPRADDAADHDGAPQPEDFDYPEAQDDEDLYEPAVAPSPQISHVVPAAVISPRIGNLVHATFERREQDDDGRTYAGSPSSRVSPASSPAPSVAPGPVPAAPLPAALITPAPSREVTPTLAAGLSAHSTPTLATNPSPSTSRKRARDPSDEGDDGRLADTERSPGDARAHNLRRRTAGTGASFTAARGPRRSQRIARRSGTAATHAPQPASTSTAPARPRLAIDGPAHLRASSSSMSPGHSMGSRPPWAVRARQERLRTASLPARGATEEQEEREVEAEVCAGPSTPRPAPIEAEAEMEVEAGPSMVLRSRKRARAQEEDEKEDESETMEDDEDDYEPPRKRRRVAKKDDKGKGKARDDGNDEADDDDDDDDAEKKSPPKGRRGGGRRKGKKVDKGKARALN
ncbi:uncharacterized protein BXZ73DRAFT_105468 [Epithele typhae]|uniref:uncharacterized protein n=1 Tax=Epithele typhae TaxID=378194 RepID=UPI002007E2FD|nr:uncharacterized protein BXZ73DRAFT_105468 [Epithele typhae]KAH9917644.1 hypothetical protein BXZ73DRAFT_105468 [Epithele typhae]